MKLIHASTPPVRKQFCCRKLLLNTGKTEKDRRFYRKILVCFIVQLCLVTVDYWKQTRGVNENLYA